MNDLDDEYEAVVPTISTMDLTPPMTYVHLTLLAHEGRIDHKIASVSGLSINCAATKYILN